MSQKRLPPPRPALCLLRAYPSSQKGGTLIAFGVDDLELHEQMLRSCDGYRPLACPSCGHAQLHVHDYRERVLRGHMGKPVTRVARYRCTQKGCEGRWQVLPELLARHLHRLWPDVEGALLSPPHQPTRPTIPARTVRRWRARLASGATELLSVLSSSFLALQFPIDDWFWLTRDELFAAWGAGLASLAELVHRLSPGVRVM